MALVPSVLTVHWDGRAEGGAPGELPSAAARRSLSEWAAARGVHLAEPSDGAVAAVAPDLTVGDAVEDLLDRARDATTAQDATGADAALLKAEALLHSHAELPQAAWLLAEVLRARSARWRRLPPHDVAESARAWARAADLDGGRAGGVGESDTDAQAPPPAARVSSTVTIEGISAGVGVEAKLDGASAARLLSPSLGEHQVTVSRSRDGAVLWAGWVTFDHDGHARVVVPHAGACSLEDLNTARLAAQEVSAAGVLCPDWLFVRETRDATGPGDIAVAWCSHDRCGPLLEWRLGAPGPVLPERRMRAHAWPAWATWTIVGASAAAITLGTLAASGVFRPTHDEPVFTTGGVRVSSIPVIPRIGD